MQEDLFAWARNEKGHEAASGDAISHRSRVKRVTKLFGMFRLMCVRSEKGHEASQKARFDRKPLAKINLAIVSSLVAAYAHCISKAGIPNPRRNPQI